jgi:ATP-binding cassette subfamily B protein
MNKTNALKTHQQHHDQSDCGVVCLKSILNFYNSDLPTEQLRTWSGTNKTGTTMLGLLQCARRIGFNAEGYEADLDNLKECNDLCILHNLKNEVLQHYVVYYGFDAKSGKFLIGDPADAKPNYLTEEELANLWQSRALLVLKPTDKLPQNNKESKFKWVLISLREDANILSMAMILGIVVSVLGLASAVFSQKFIDVLLPSNDLTKIIYGSLLFLVLMLINGFFNYIKQLFLMRQGKAYNIRIIDFFYSKLLHLPKSFFDSRKTGDLVARMNDTNRIQSTITSFVSSIVTNLMMVIVSSVAIFSYSSKLGFLSLLWIPIFLLIVIFYHPKILKAQKILMQTYSQNESNYIDTIKGIDSIKSNNKQTYFTKHTKTTYSTYKEASYTLGKIGLNYQFITQIFGALFVVGLIIYASYLVINNTFTSGGVIAILQLTTLLMGSVGSLALLNIQLQEAKVALDRMFEYTNLNEESDNISTVLTPNLSTLEVNNITFGYPGRSKIIQNLSTSIKKGDCLGIVGEIGSGKSTLLQIIQNFYHPDIGNISINKTININNINLESWRKTLGVVSQQTHIFTGSVLYNISLDDNETIENVIQFCKNIGFDNCINSFPQSYYTIVGEEGINLSGGQLQLIALARALYKKPKILLLDEVTSSMDSNTENFVLELLNNLKKDIIMIFVTHKEKSLSKIADNIISIG